jgi:hypothetical protein
VVLFDEADGLVGEAMVAFLTQLRQGYIERSKLPSRPAWCSWAQRQVRDYALDVEERRVVSEATTLGSFTEVEVAESYDQHTANTRPRRAALRAARVDREAALQRPEEIIDVGAPPVEGRDLRQQVLGHADGALLVDQLLYFGRRAFGRRA